MQRTALALLVVIFLVGGASSTSRAEDASPTDARVAALERKIQDLQQQLVTLQQQLAVLRARPHDVPAQPLSWTTLVDGEHLTARLTAAAKERRPAVVFVGATWCTYSQAYKRMIEDDAALRRGFASLVRLEIDVERDAREDLRKAVGLGDGQPLMAFFDATGEPVPDAAIGRWHAEESAKVLERSLEATLR